MEWETHSLDGWPADATAWEQSGGWRPSKTPNVCVKYHSFFSFPRSLPYMHTSPFWFPRITFSVHTDSQYLFTASESLRCFASTGIIRCRFSSFHACREDFTFYVSVNVEKSPYMAEHRPLILLKLLQHMQHWQIALPIIHFKSVFSAQRHSIINAIANNCTTSMNSHVQYTQLNCWQPQPNIQVNASSTSLPCLLPISPSALPPHLLLPHLPTDLWPSFNPLLLLSLPPVAPSHLPPRLLHGTSW